jgi:hypothetical protein
MARASATTDLTTAGKTTGLSPHIRKQEAAGRSAPADGQFTLGASQCVRFDELFWLIADHAA